MSILKDKMKLLKADLKVWNRNTFGCLETSKKRIVLEIEELDAKDDNDALDGIGNLRRMELVSQLGLVDKKLDSIYRQKARVNWSKYGDTNSKFFHSAIRWRRLKNEVKGVVIDSQWCEEPEVVRREAKLLFENRFKATKDYGVTLGSVEFKSLSLEVSRKMISDFTEEEVRDAVWQCGGSKSPRPDGFNFNFIKKCWDILKMDLMEAVRFFQATGSFPKGCNASFIALVPKVRDPSSLEHFRPISLVGAIYKIITKVLSIWMKEVCLRSLMIANLPSLATEVSWIVWLWLMKFLRSVGGPGGEVYVLRWTSKRRMILSGGASCLTCYEGWDSMKSGLCGLKGAWSRLQCLFWLTEVL